MCVRAEKATSISSPARLSRTHVKIQIQRINNVLRNLLKVNCRRRVSCVSCRVCVCCVWRRASQSDARSSADRNLSNARSAEPPDYTQTQTSIDGLAGPWIELLVGAQILPLRLMYAYFITINKLVQKLVAHLAISLALSSLVLGRLLARTQHEICNVRVCLYVVAFLARADSITSIKLVFGCAQITLLFCCNNTEATAAECSSRSSMFS